MFLSSLLAKAKWYPVLFDTPLNAVRSVAIWLTCALLIAFIVCAVVLKAEKRKKFLKISLFAAVAYACVLGLIFLVLSFQEDGIETILFIPLLLLLITIAAGAVLIFFRPGFKSYLISGILVGAALIASLVCMGIHFSSGDAAENNWLTNDDVNTLGLYISAVLAIAALLAAAFFFGRKDKKGFDSKSITYAAICVAMSFALSYLKIVKMPQGGSITIASLLPLMIYAYMFGVKKGVFVGMIYGILQAFQTPTILHPAQFLLDYPLAFSCVGFAGLFAEVKAFEKVPQVSFALGGIVAGLARFVMHFLAGIFAFGVFADGQNVVLYSFTYQAGYVLPDIAIAILAGIFVFTSKAFVAEVRKFRA